MGCTWTKKCKSKTAFPTCSCVYNDPDVKYNDVTLDDGTVFTWPRNEHCAALSGYDIDRGVVTLADPTYGIVERSMEEFVTYYQKYYYQAVVVR